MEGNKMENKIIFEEIKLKNGQTIKNRIVKSAMSEGLGNKNNDATEKHISLYSKWASSEIGMVITGNVMVDREQLSEPGNVVIDEKTDKNMLKKWAEAGTANGTSLIMQINHPGKQAPKTMSRNPVAPSITEVHSELKSAFNEARELTNAEVKELVKKFVKAGEIAKETGFSGVQIHAAHGYLISQFLTPADNKRTDEYGGNLENRRRFLKEIYSGLREKLGNDYIIGLKLNSSDLNDNGFTEEESHKVILEMEKLGMDIARCFYFLAIRSCKS